VYIYCSAAALLTSLSSYRQQRVHTCRKWLTLASVLATPSRAAPLRLGTRAASSLQVVDSVNARSPVTVAMRGEWGRGERAQDRCVRGFTVR
jgi:hypothetical protein